MLHSSRPMQSLAGYDRNLQSRSRVIPHAVLDSMYTRDSPLPHVFHTSSFVGNNVVEHYSQVARSRLHMMSANLPT